MPEKRIVNGYSVWVDVSDPKTDSIEADYKLGSTVGQIATTRNSDVAINFNYAVYLGPPYAVIGRLKVNGVTVASDSSKTLTRDELYSLPNGTWHIGKAPTDAVHILQGSPVLRRNGKDVIDETVKRDGLTESVWRRAAVRTAVGIRTDGCLVSVVTVGEITLRELGRIFDTLGCPNAINADGGGSSMMWPASSSTRRLSSGLFIKKGVKKLPPYIALCDGHGLTPVPTAGKRTFKFEDGSVMYENEFNRAVVAALDVHLKRCGFRTLLVAPTDDDTPLNTRIARANNAKVDLYLSVHANASNAKTTWDNVRGIETLYFTNSTKSRRPAEIIHRHLIAGTALPNRGVKQRSDLAVLRDTTMAAVLVECGFMTNRLDAELLHSDVYRKECAEELARGCCEIFGMAWVKEPTPPPVVTTPDVTVVYKGKQLVDGHIKNGTTFVPVRSIAETLGLNVQWVEHSRTVILTDK